MKTSGEFAKISRQQHTNALAAEAGASGTSTIKSEILTSESSKDAISMNNRAAVSTERATASDAIV